MDFEYWVWYFASWGMEFKERMCFKHSSHYYWLLYSYSESTSKLKLPVSEEIGIDIMIWGTDMFKPIFNLVSFLIGSQNGVE